MAPGEAPRIPIGEHPLVSVVTPCLNNAPFLPRCLASIREQSYDRVEHIVIDGGSTDGTVDLLRREERIRWVSESDGGQTEAINKGWRMAGGEVLTWINADDWLYPGGIESAVTALANAPDAGWVIGRARAQEDGRSRDVPPPKNLSLADLDESNPIAQPGTFITRWALDRVGFLDESEDLEMDLELWYRLLLAGIRPVTIPDMVAGMEIHRGTKTRTRGDRAYATDRGLARLKHGRTVAGSVWLGRAAAYSARDSGATGLAALDEEVTKVIALAENRGYLVSPSAVRAGARTTAASLERNPARRLLYLLAREPWMHRATRRVLAQATAGRLSRRTPSRAST